MRESSNYKTQHLVRLAKSGDELALERLFRAYGERVQRIIRLRMGKELRSKLESMDLVQDAFVSALRGLESFTYTNEGDFLRWLSKIAENRIRDNFDKLHADKRDIRREIPLDNSRGDAQESFAHILGPVDSTTPSLIMSKKEQLDKLEKAVDALRPEYREVVVLAKIEGLSYKEVGNRLGKSPDAVRMLLSRAMAALSQGFEKTE
jgi:RNA polymerase sigma-70 factor (ECF subfamily)